jgi:hypothetical protein
MISSPGLLFSFSVLLILGLLILGKTCQEKGSFTAYLLLLGDSAVFAVFAVPGTFAYTVLGFRYRLTKTFSPGEFTYTCCVVALASAFAVPVVFGTG